MQLKAEDFHLFYNEHCLLVRNIVYRLNGDDDIDDLVQSIFVKIYFHLDTFKGEAHIKTWIYRVSVNTVKDYWKVKSRKNWLSFFRNTELPEEGKSENYEKKLELSEVYSFIQRKLSPKLREVLILYSFEELNPKEIASILKIPEGTVKSRLHKAQSLLKKYRLLKEDYEII